MEKKIAFTPKARLINILGEQLIKDASVGIVELIKNSYDADATKVEIIVDKPHSTDCTLIIKDNGFGIDLDTFLNKWMNPATGHKEHSKKALLRTPGGRLPLGEKGVGRFSAQQIGKKLKLVSKVATEENELEVSIDWEVFRDENKNLSDIEIPYSFKKASVFRSDGSGTILEIRELTTVLNLEILQNALRRLKSPFKGASDFDIHFTILNGKSEDDKYCNLENSDILEKAPYRFIALVDENGSVDYEYTFNYPGFPVREYRSSNDTFDNKVLLNTELIKDIKKTNVGAFIIQLFVFDRRAASLKQVGLGRAELKDRTGISLYRDGIRVFPYGEPGNDWLKLDNRRIQSPSTKIGNDQVIGAIEINQKDNLGLKDKTNREGLIENDTYNVFVQTITAIITSFEAELLNDRKKIIPKRSKISVKDISSSSREILESLSGIKAFLTKTAPEESQSILPNLESIEKNITELKGEATDTIEELEKEKQMLFNVAGTGLAAERFTHEFSRLVKSALDVLSRMERSSNTLPPNISKDIQALRSILDALRNDILLLGPMFYIKKVAAEKVLDLQTIIRSTIRLHEKHAKNERVQIQCNDLSFSVKMREGSCMQVFSNLLDNCIYWCSKRTEEDRLIKIIVMPDKKAVYITDNGPGIAPRFWNTIFDAFFTMKDDGRGLGLYIVKEILDEKRFKIFCVDSSEHNNLLPGANFKILFSEEEPLNESINN